MASEQPRHSVKLMTEHLEPGAGAESLVSIVVPCFGQAQYLEECVASVLMQSYPSWELIIVDDGSPDDCAEIASRIIADNPDREIRLVRKSNGGVASARNTGISGSRGEYILPLDADDALEAKYLERTVAALDVNDEIQFVYTDHRHFGVSNLVVRCSDYSPRSVLYHNRFAYCTLFRRKVWDEVGGYSSNMAGYEDWDFWVGAVEHALRGFHVAEVLFRYRVKDVSRDTQAREKDTELKARIILNHPAVYTPALRAYAQRLLSAQRRDGTTETWRMLQGITLDLWLAQHAGEPRLISRVLRALLRRSVGRLPFPVSKEALPGTVARR